MKGKIFILALLTLVFHMSQGQNIGIGQASPKAPLDINGGVTIGTGASYSGSATSTTGALIQGPVGIGNHSPNINSILDLTNSATSVNSTTGGLLLPKVANIATETGMASPANGTVFYNTSTNCVDLYDNGKWQSIFCSCPALATPAISGPSSPCALSTNNVYSVPAISGATSYTWSISGATFTTTPATNATSVSVTAPANTTPFTLNCTISNACGTSIVTATTTITPNYTVATITGATVSATAYQYVNYNQSVVYTLPTGGSSYSWSVAVASGGYTPIITPSTGSNTVTVSWAGTSASIGTEDDVTVTGSYIPSGSTCPSVGSLAVEAGGSFGTLSGLFTPSNGQCEYYSLPYNAPVSANWGATNYNVTVAGASGGVNSAGSGTPGYGEVITASITVPLSALPFYAMTGTVGLSGAATTGPDGGCFAGASGGDYYYFGGTDYSGGGGGGSTSIQTDATVPYSSADAVIVAGGGGGAGYDVGGAVINGGNAGAVGYPGGSTTAGTAANGDSGGGGGTGAGGGAGASYNGGCGTDAAGAGIQGEGGTPGIGTSGGCYEYGGAGGGQGWYGGGGGGSGAGGGGSSYPTANGTYNGITVTNLSVPATGTNNGNGYVIVLF